MNSKFSILFVGLFFGFIPLVSAYTPSLDKKDSPSQIISAYRTYKDVEKLLINVPTVIEVPFDEFIKRLDFAVFDVTSNTFEPYYFKQGTVINTTPITVKAIPEVVDLNKMIDKDTQTYTDFLLSENNEGQIQIIVSAPSPITSSDFTLLLGNNVSLPTFVDISADVNGQRRTIVLKREMNEQIVRFPQTTSDTWYITFTYKQPLRINEFYFNQDNAIRSNINAIRFLAQPSHFYRIYLNPDRPVKASVGEAGNLASVQNVMIVQVKSRQNPEYIIVDTDHDTIPDISDNCPLITNVDQKDIDRNGQGDVCDDFDRDTVLNTKDNCPNVPNRNQEDEDHDGIGNVCDTEESRITEKHAWIPWVSIGFAMIVLIVLVFLTARTNPSREEL